MKATILHLILPLVIFISACEKEKSDGLTGYWISDAASDSLTSYRRVMRFEDSYGFAFKEGHVFVEYKNAGWCGTPPVSYAEFEGTWEQVDSIIHITVPYWGGTAEYTWEVVSINEDFLTIRWLEQEYQQEDSGGDSSLNPAYGL